MTDRPVLVWAEIPVSDMEKSCAFYAKVFDYEVGIDSSGPNPIAILNNEMNAAAAHLYPGKAAEGGNGPTVHLALKPGVTVEQGEARVKENGGSVVGPLVEMPFGRFSYAIDLDGNSIGLFEAKSM